MLGPRELGRGNLVTKRGGSELRVAMPDAAGFRVSTGARRRPPASSLTAVQQCEIEPGVIPEPGFIEADRLPEGSAGRAVSSEHRERIHGSTLTYVFRSRGQPNRMFIVQPGCFLEISPSPRRQIAASSATKYIIPIELIVICQHPFSRALFLACFERGFPAGPGHKDMARHGLLVCLPTSLKGQWSGESGAKGITGQQCRFSDRDYIN